MSGVASLCSMSFLDMRRHPSTATNRRFPDSPPRSKASFEVNVTASELRAEPRAPHMGRYRTGSVVGMDALGSPMAE